MNPDLATRVTQNLQARYARLRRGCWDLLRKNADLREQVRSADSNTYYIAELEERIAVWKRQVEIMERQVADSALQLLKSAQENVALEETYSNLYHENGALMARDVEQQKRIVELEAHLVEDHNFIETVSVAATVEIKSLRAQLEQQRKQSIHSFGEAFDVLGELEKENVALKAKLAAASQGGEWQPVANGTYYMGGKDAVTVTEEFLATTVGNEAMGVDLLRGYAFCALVPAEQPERRWIHVDGTGEE